MVIRMRHTRSQRGNRRAHLAIVPQALSRCESCGAARLQSSACPACGKYRGRQILNVQKKIDKVARRQKEQEKARR